MYIDALKSQLNSLKHQINLSKKVFEADLRTANEDFERKVELSLKEKNYSKSLQREKISDLEQAVQEEKEKSSFLRQELNTLASFMNQELLSAEEKKRILTEDLKILTEELKTQKSHISLLQSELFTIENDFDSSKQYLSSKFESNYMALSSKYNSNKGKIRTLEQEIEELRKILKAKDESGIEDIKTLEEALRSTYHTIELQTINLEKIKKAKEDFAKEASLYEKQKNQIFEEEKKLIQENNELKENIDKLERKIYGRKARNN